MTGELLISSFSYLLSVRSMNYSTMTYQSFRFLHTFIYVIILDFKDITAQLFHIEIIRCECVKLVSYPIISVFNMHCIHSNKLLVTMQYSYCLQLGNVLPLLGTNGRSLCKYYYTQPNGLLSVSFTASRTRINNGALNIIDDKSFLLQ